MSFRDCRIAAHDVRFDDEPPAVEEFLSSRGERMAARLVSQGVAPREAFAGCPRVGGFPPAANESLFEPGREVSIETVQMLWDVIAEISRALIETGLPL